MNQKNEAPIKPVTIKRAEFANALINLINESELPSFVVTDTMHIILNQVESDADMQLQKDIAAYRKSLESYKELTSAPSDSAESDSQPKSK